MSRALSFFFFFFVESIMASPLLQPDKTYTLDEAMQLVAAATAADSGALLVREEQSGDDPFHCTSVTRVMDRHDVEVRFAHLMQSSKMRAQCGDGVYDETTQTFTVYAYPSGNQVTRRR
jgi:hypothetical protein